MALPAGGGGPPSPGGGGGIPPLPDGAAVSPAMDAEFGSRIVLPGPPQVKPLAQFFSVCFKKNTIPNPTPIGRRLLNGEYIVLLRSYQQLPCLGTSKCFMS